MGIWGQKSQGTLLFLVIGSLFLSGCTTSAESQLKESVCKHCRAQPEFYRNGLWLEEQRRE